MNSSSVIKSKVKYPHLRLSYPDNAFLVRVVNLKGNSLHEKSQTYFGKDVSNCQNGDLLQKDTPAIQNTIKSLLLALSFCWIPNPKFV